MENQGWERDTINKMLEMAVREQRAKRRWGIFFKLVLIGFILFFVSQFMFEPSDVNVSRKPVTAVVNIDGEIMPDKDISADNIIPLLRKAFANTSAKAVMLRINSPGGAPVQTKEMTAEIAHLRTKFPDKKVYAVIEDMGASAAYELACAADEIYADQASLVGSIGVLMDSFGFVDAMKKLGVERRLYTSGSNKGMLDPFSPAKADQVAMLQTDLDTLHQLFIDYVKERRGSRLHESPDMFSGRFWIGAQAKELGLIDGFGDPYTVARDIIGAPELMTYEVKQNIFSQLRGSVTGAMRDIFFNKQEARLH